MERRCPSCSAFWARNRRGGLSLDLKGVRLVERKQSVLRALRGCGDETSELPRLRPRVDRQQSGVKPNYEIGDLQDDIS